MIDPQENKNLLLILFFIFFQSLKTGNEDGGGEKSERLTSQNDTSSSTTETVKEPELVKTDNATTNLENGVNEEEKISYNGAKVLRVLVPNKEVKKLIKQMENNGGN